MRLSLYNFVYDDKEAPVVSANVACGFSFSTVFAKCLGEVPANSNRDLHRNVGR